MKYVVALFALVLVAAVSGDPTRNPDDRFRNEFDFLLMQEIEEKMEELERNLLRLSEQVAELEKTKSKELKETILREITIGENFAVGALGFLERQQKRTDLDLFEKFNYDVAVESTKLLIQDLQKLADKVKEIETEQDVLRELFLY